MREKTAKIGIDVGGTFTDFVLARGDGLPLIYHKEPSTPGDPARAVVSGFGAIVALAGIAPADIALIAHGTTIGLNAIIQRKGARTGLVVSTGFRDILELGRCKIAHPLKFFSRPEPPLIPRYDVVETSLRLAAGSPGAPAEQEEIERVAAAIAALGLESCAVALTNSYLHPEVEADFARRLSESLGFEATASCTLWPEIREYERAMVAVMNAYVAPLMRSYLTRIETGLNQTGFTGRLLITSSNGGTLPIELARSRPADTLLSGPAAGVVASARYAGMVKMPNVITVDMGGTSSDMSVVVGAEVEYSTRAHVGDFPLFMPVVSVSAIGAGGGSIVRVDDHGVMKVGPESAGAHPGPVSYGRGGTQPTVTDCYLVCGFLARDQALGGQVALSYDAARTALQEIADRMGFTGEDGAERAAWAAIRVATAKMATELRKGLAERGIDATGYALLPFGGAGPVQAALLADEARLERIVLPEAPGTFCAMGAMVGDLKRDFSRSILRDFGSDLSGELRKVARALEGEAQNWLAEAGDIVLDTDMIWRGAMRYAGQSHELSVQLPREVIEGDDDAFVATFHAEHRRCYGFADESSAVTITALQLTAQGGLRHFSSAQQPLQAPAAEMIWREVFFAGAWHRTAVIDRATLAPGVTVPVPAIITQKDTTSVVPPGWRVSVEQTGAIILDRVRA